MNILFRLLILIFLYSPFVSYANEPTFSGGCKSDNQQISNNNITLADYKTTHCDGGDLFTGKISLSISLSDIKKYDFFVSGYSKNKGISLDLINNNGQRSPITTVNSDSDKWSEIVIDAPIKWSKDDVIQLIASDESKAWTGWIGLAYAPHATQAYPTVNYFYFAVESVVVILFLLIPGIYLHLHHKLKIGFIPVPGILINSFFGIAFWLSSDVSLKLITYGYILLYSIFIVLLLSKPFTNNHPHIKSRARLLFVIFFMSVANLVAIGVNHLPITQEYAETTNIPGRMIASPPDHVIPFSTAVYFLNHLDGKEKSSEYFGDWNVTSRGPLAPLGIASMLAIFNYHPQNATLPERSPSWPTGVAGEHIARIYGWVLNLFVLFGAFQLLNTLNVSSQRQILTLLWLAASPVIVINGLFLWPKLLATYFFLLAISTIIEKRFFVTGCLIALSWLSHPVGALMLPALLLFCFFSEIHARQTIYQAVTKCSLIISGLFLLMLPWFIYKSYLGYHDQFFAYILAGGQGTKISPNVNAWISTRISNIYITLVPSAFYFSDFMQKWLYGDLSDTARWLIQYAKTLPGHLGLSCFIFSYLALCKKTLPANIKNIRTWLIFTNFIIMIFYWGFSADGLGRNCLEPLSILIVIFTMASLKTHSKYIHVVISMLAFESLFFVFSSFISTPNFGIHYLRYDAITLLIINLIILTIFSCIALTTKISTDPEQKSLSNQ